MRGSRLVAISGSLLVVVAFLVTAGPGYAAGTPTPTQAAIHCEYSAVCAEVADSASVFGSEYVGHDEPSLVFYSNVAGAGNHMSYSLRLPRDPSSANPTPRASPTSLSSTARSGSAWPCVPHSPIRSRCRPARRTAIPISSIRRSLPTIRAPRSWNCSFTRRVGSRGPRGRSPSAQALATRRSGAPP